MRAEPGHTHQGERLLTILEVKGRPATFATQAEVAWKEAVRTADAGVQAPDNARFCVRISFRTPKPKNANERWDIDNLVKPTLDAMEGVFGRRDWKGLPQPPDDRVDRLEAEKRGVKTGEEAGARIEVWIRRGNSW